jgi:rubrerythrin
MTIEQALREALSHEIDVRDLYTEAARNAGDTSARGFYQSLGKDEQSHVNYLEEKLKEWKAEGRITYAGLASALPDPGVLESAAETAGSSLAGKTPGGDTEALSRALAAEERSVEFYGGLVAGLGAEASKLFTRFLEIEEGHRRIVRAELDLATRTGHWFDFRDFDMED